MTDTTKEKRTVHVEIAVDPACLVPLPQLSLQWQRFLEQRPTISAADVKEAPVELRATCVDISMVVDDATIHNATTATFDTKKVQLVVHLFILTTEQAATEELEPVAGDDEWTAACENLTLPHASLSGLWESLLFEGPIQANLLQFAKSALLFGDKAVAGHIVHWNRLLVFYGPPGTGKTSLCRALAQKLSIRLQPRFPRAALLEIHSHSLFSKWFSTSGKLVSRLFQMVADMVQDDPDCLIMVLIDEIESLAGSRAAQSASGEPSDAVRAVNSLLTSLDRLRAFPNVLILATTNLTQTVDVAFMDRADLKLYIGLPCLSARYEILRSCLVELVRVGIVVTEPETPLLSFGNDFSGDEASAQLLELAQRAKDMSGRSLRRLPLQAHALFVGTESSVSMHEFLQSLGKAIDAELETKERMQAQG